MLFINYPYPLFSALIPKDISVQSATHYAKSKIHRCKRLQAATSPKATQRGVGTLASPP